jgi:hypothetical protein
MKQSFDVSDYVIQFKSIFSVPEISLAWISFLKQEFNDENWQFIQQLQELEKITKKKDHFKIFKLVESIIAQFISEKSPKEIAVGKAHKENILKEFKKVSKKSWNISVSPLELFEPLKNMIILEYKNDSFKRFTRTEECLKLVEKHQKNQQVLLPQLSMVYNYTDEDFKQKPLTTKDIEFLNHFQEDNPNWEMVYEDKKNKVYAFRSEWNYFPNVEFIGKTYINGKIQITFDYPLQKVACAIFGNYKNQDPFATRTRVLEYKHNDHVIIEQNSVMAAFQEPRIKKMYYAMEYDPEAKKITSRGETVPSRWSIFKVRNDECSSEKM